MLLTLFFYPFVLNPLFCRSHSNERPHRCPYCVSKFKRAYVLKNHIKQHIGVKGYNLFPFNNYLLFCSIFAIVQICFVCFLLFSNSFPCTFVNCSKEYRTQWELNSHQRQKHQNDVSKDENSAEIVGQMGDASLSNNSIKEEEHQTTDNNEMVNWSQKPKIAMKTIYIMPGPMATNNTVNYTIIII